MPTDSRLPKRLLSKIRLLVILAGIAVAFFTGCGFLGGIHWTLDVASHFRLQYLLLAAACLAALIVFRMCRPVVVLFPAAALAANLVVIVPLYLPAPRPAEKGLGGHTLRILAFNTWRLNDNSDEVIVFIQDCKPHIAFIQETTRRVRQDITRLAGRFEIRMTKHNILLVARDSGVPLEILDIRDGPLEGERSMLLDARFGTRRFKLLGAHLPAPRKHAVENALQFERMAAWYRNQSLPAILIGDFNATTWSAAFRKLMRKTDLHNSQIGFGVQGTWYSRWPLGLNALLCIPIDHCLHSPMFETVMRRVGPATSSNHLPLLVELM